MILYDKWLQDSRLSKDVIESLIVGWWEEWLIVLLGVMKESHALLYLLDDLQLFLFLAILYVSLEVVVAEHLLNNITKLTIKLSVHYWMVLVKLHFLRRAQVGVFLLFHLNIDRVYRVAKFFVDLFVAVQHEFIKQLSPF